MQTKKLEQAIQKLKENDFSVRHWENYGKERYYITSDRFRLNVFISIEENGIFLNTKSQSETKTVLHFFEEILDAEAISEKIGCLFRCEKRVPLFFLAEKEQQTEEVAEETATETVRGKKMEVEAIRPEDGKIFCIVYDDISKDDILLNEEQIRECALEEALTEREKEIIMNSIFEIIPQDEGGFYVEFWDFYHSPSY